MRPDDHVDAAPASGPPAQPRLDARGYARFFWRQLTSMRTAIVLLLLLAVAAVPGSLVPQRSSDPNGVIQYKQQYPELFPVLDSLSLFDTFSSPWFSAIYLLLFVSLVGCILPRTKHHFDALRARPPRTPARLERLVGFRRVAVQVDPESAVESARSVLRGQGYRVERYDGSGVRSISAERGYLRETGNLIFHISLVGVLIAVGIGGGFGYSGQRILVQDTAFTNSLGSYDSFNPGRFFTDDQLDAYAIRLDDFVAEYEFDLDTISWQPLDFDAQLSVREQGGEWEAQSLRINAPLDIAGTQVYLLGNGYAPIVTVRDPAGTIVSSGPVAFRPQDNNLFSLGVIKVPDGLDEQLGMVGIFAPDAIEVAGVLASFSPEPADPLLQLEVYSGDLGLDDGVSVNAYALDTDDLTPLAGRTADEPALELALGDEVELPNGLGTVEFTELRRFVSIEIHHDPSQVWVLLFSITLLGGLLVSLFVPRRRVWIKVRDSAEGTVLEYAGLARGEDARLADAVADLAIRHTTALGVPAPERHTEPRMDA
ncbi:MAG: cytochrome C biogenesis protein [Leifsonia sp.]|nr:cytochrome C biogenesis protein [Leifsonia sp.]|tara:strand:+ start:21225 stop:22844 length:1620 start_codon:yes stop_codon:yes gene_type:complete